MIDRSQQHRIATSTSTFPITDAPMKIGILGHYGYGNLGDDIVVAILIKKIRDHYPNAELIAFSLNPADTEHRHAIQAFPIRRQSEIPRRGGPPSRSAVASLRSSLLARLKGSLQRCPRTFTALRRLKMFIAEPLFTELAFLRRSLHRLRGVDLLIVPGSCPLTDWWGGPWRHPYALLSWSTLARLTRTKFIALSIGSERLDTRLGKSFCRWSLSLAHYRSFRDRYSRDAMRQLGLRASSPVYPDQGFALRDLLPCDATDASRAESGDSTLRLTVGVNPVGQWTCVPPGADASWYQRYLGHLSAFLVWLLQQGHHIIFCPSDATHDPPFVREMLTAIRIAARNTNLRGQVVDDPVDTVEDLVKRIQSCDIMIASRFHGVVLSFALQKPVFAVSYSRKLKDLMIECGQGAYHREMDEVTVDEMIRLFQDLAQNRSLIAQHLGSVVPSYRASLARQYDEVFTRFKCGPDVNGARTVLED